MDVEENFDLDFAEFSFDVELEEGGLVQKNKNEVTVTDLPTVFDKQQSEAAVPTMRDCEPLIAALAQVNGHALSWMISNLAASGGVQNRTAVKVHGRERALPGIVSLARMRESIQRMKEVASSHESDNDSTLMATLCGRLFIEPSPQQRFEFQHHNGKAWENVYLASWDGAGSLNFSSNAVDADPEAYRHLLVDEQRKAHESILRASESPDFWSTPYEIQVHGKNVRPTDVGVCTRPEQCEGCPCTCPKLTFAGTQNVSYGSDQQRQELSELRFQAQRRGDNRKLFRTVAMQFVTSKRARNKFKLLFKRHVVYGPMFLSTHIKHRDRYRLTGKQARYRVPSATRDVRHRYAGMPFTDLKEAHRSVAKDEGMEDGAKLAHLTAIAQELGKQITICPVCDEVVRENDQTHSQSIRHMRKLSRLERLEGQRTEDPDKMEVHDVLKVIADDCEQGHVDSCDICNASTLTLKTCCGFQSEQVYCAACVMCIATPDRRKYLFPVRSDGSCLTCKKQANGQWCIQCMHQKESRVTIMLELTQEVENEIG